MADSSFQGRARAWLAHDPDPKSRAQIAAWLEQNDAEALRAAFDGRVAFGTAGLRAEVGPGPTRLNALVIRQSAAGVARALADAGHAGQRVAVGYDGRLDSADWAGHAVGVLRACGHPVDLLDAPAPTPLTGFWVKAHGLCAALVVTASHNPPADNGLKIYWAGGAQIAPPVDAAIAAAIETVAAGPEAVPFLPAAKPGPALCHVHDRALDAYVEALAGQRFAAPHGTKGQPLRVAYTPLHGVGARAAARVLAGGGDTALYVVAHQQQPDGHFPSLRSPNPEDPRSLEAVLALAREQQADLACANDPDADRLAVAVADADGAMTVLSGDELGLLLADSLLARAPSPADAQLASSCVSSQRLADLCGLYGARHVSTLPGFKWLAQAMQAAAADGRTPLFAYEEALGFMPGSLVWDKDGISSLRLAVDVAAHAKARGGTLLDALGSVYRRVGVSVTRQATLRIEGAKAGEAGGRAASLMQALREQAHTRLGDFRLLRIDDGLVSATGGTFAGLPASNALALHLAPDSPAARAASVRIVLRPSGTEPKLKAYYEALAPPAPSRSWQALRAELAAELDALVLAHGALVAEAASAQARATAAAKP